MGVFYVFEIVQVVPNRAKHSKSWKLTWIKIITLECLTNEVYQIDQSICEAQKIFGEVTATRFEPTTS